MKTFVKSLTVMALTAGLSLPIVSFANQTMTSISTPTTQPKQVIQLAKVKMQYKDAHGNMKSVIAYVPKDHVDEMRKAKNIQLLQNVGTDLVGWANSY